MTRPTDYERLLHAHATPGQATFFLKSRGQTLDAVLAQHRAFVSVVHEVRAALPLDWRSAHISREDLDRFLFAPEDIVVAIGQDGLVANVAKYLSGQPVLGVNPAPEIYEGVLVPLRAADVHSLAVAAASQTITVERRTMARVTLDDGQTLQALNEIFIGHRSHQSARYVITAGGKSESQSSSGVIVTTGTGATGWARSITTSMRRSLRLAPTDRSLAFFVREPGRASRPAPRSSGARSAPISPEPTVAHGRGRRDIRRRHRAGPLVIQLGSDRRGGPITRHSQLGRTQPCGGEAART